MSRKGPKIPSEEKGPEENPCTLSEPEPCPVENNYKPDNIVYYKAPVENKNKKRRKLREIPPLHLAGMVILVNSVILHIICMWSPQWSRWEGGTCDTDDRESEAYKWKDDSKFREVHDHGPWQRNCWCRQDDDTQPHPHKPICYYDEDPDKCVKGGGGYSDIWSLGTRTGTYKCSCVTDGYWKFVSVLEPGGVCTHTRIVKKEPKMDEEEVITEEWNKCYRLLAVKAFTLAPMFLGLLAIGLSILAIVVPPAGKYACLGCCGAALLAGFFIFVAVCVWADIYRWTKMIMVERCRTMNYDIPNSPKYGDFDCWGTTGSYYYDDEDWKDISPPYRLSWAWGLEIPTMLIIPIGGLLVGLGGYKP